MPTNDYLMFANATSANVPTQAAWAAAPVLATGVEPGVANSSYANKIWRQSATISKVLTTLINDKTSLDTLDDGTYDTLLKNLSLSLMTNNYLIDTSGTVNVLAGNFTPALTALINGMTVIVKPAITNTGAVTLDINGISTNAVETSSGALTPGQLVAGYPYAMTYNSTSLKWNLINPTISSSTVGLNYSIDSSSFANTIVAPSSIAALVDGVVIIVRMTHTNTNTCTLNVNGLGAYSVVTYKGQQLFGGELYLGSQYIFIWNAPRNTWTVINPDLVARQMLNGIMVTTYSVGLADSTLTFNLSATCTLTLPSVLNNVGRKLYLKGATAFAVNSGSANVIPLTSTTTPGTAILPATAGKWCTLECDGSNWNIIASN